MLGLGLPLLRLRLRQGRLGCRELLLCLGDPPSASCRA